MAYDLRQNFKLTQSLLMTPQLQQAIKLLQLSRMELEQFVEAQLAENPVLEEGQTESVEERVQVEREAERTEAQAVSDHISSATSMLDSVNGDTKQEVDWDSMARYEESAAPIPSSMTSSSSNRFDDEQPNYENMVTRTATLQEHLMAQIGELELSEDEKRVALVLTGNIDDKGYLATSLEELCNQESFDKELAEGVLDTIQRLDPPGIGATSLKECLLIQLRLGKLKNGVVEKIVENHLTDLENRNYPAIAKAMKIPMEKVIENVAIIAELEPIPGRQFSTDSAQYIVPDVYVFKLGDEWVVSLNEDGLPKLRVSKFYNNMVTSKEAQGADKNYIQEKMKSAVWLIKSIQQRQRTIFRATESIVARQKDFFELGAEHLKPMILKDIAEDIEMHESTISRVTSNKYVHTPRGIFELKYFFNSSVAKTDGDSVASESVKRMISEIVKSEDQLHPHSDQRIVELLEERGIQLARRTVAKYREQLNILPSSKRKKYC